VKRLTGERTAPATPIEEWRVVPSQSIGYDGWFLQGGRWEPKNGRREFKAAVEGFFDCDHKKQADRICRILKRAQEARISDQ
jgi:hypothetical protein